MKRFILICHFFIFYSDDNDLPDKHFCDQQEHEIVDSVRN